MNSGVFEKYKLPPQEDSNCFSIFTSHRTLDLKADDENISKKWFNAIKILSKKYRSMRELKQNKNFLHNMKKRKEFIDDIWKSEIIPNWSLYRDFIIHNSRYKIEFPKEISQTGKKNKEK